MKRIRHIIALSVLLLSLPGSSFAQVSSNSIFEGGELSNSTLQLFALIATLSLAPAILVTITSFPFFVTVFAILRQGIGLQQSPPNMLIVSLSLFLTYFVMEDTFVQAWKLGIEPFSMGAHDFITAIDKSIGPFRDFMNQRVDLNTLQAISDIRESSESSIANEAPTLSVLLPSFLLSEISRAFQVGFVIYLPFLVIDLVVAAILMSMGMMMVPPAIVSLPFKLAFFVVSDGWVLLSGSLVQSFF